MDDVKKSNIDTILDLLGNLSIGYYNSNGIVLTNMRDEYFREFSFNIDPEQLFESEIYRYSLAAVLTDFINKVRYDINWESQQLDRDSFFSYIDYLGVNDDVFSIDYDRLRRFIREEDKDVEFLVNVYYILKMIQQSLCTNDLNVYNYFESEAKNEESRKEVKNAIDLYDLNKGKKNLLDEWILTTMIKYPKVASFSQKVTNGTDLIVSYLSYGNAIVVTNTNSLRDRVSNGLKPEEALRIIESSEIYDKNKSFMDNVNNYINMVMVNKIISSMIQYGNDFVVGAFKNYMLKGDKKCITIGIDDNGIDALLTTLNKDELISFFNRIGSSLEEYIESYSSDRKGPRRG